MINCSTFVWVSNRGQVTEKTLATEAGEGERCPAELEQEEGFTLHLPLWSLEQEGGP